MCGIAPRYRHRAADRQRQRRLNHITVSPPQQVVCFAAFNQAIPEPLSWEELSRYPLISGPENSVLRKMISGKLKEHGLECRHFIADVSSTDWCKQLVQNGQGISFTIAEDIKEALAQNLVKLVPLEDPLYLTAEAVVRSDIFMNPTTREFIVLVKQAFGYAKKAA